MRNWVLAILALVGACSWSYKPSPAETPQSPIARCMNLGGALESPYSEGEWGYRIDREDIRLLKEAGFDTVRIPVNWGSRVDKQQPYKIEDEFLDRVEEIVGWATLYGLNAIINVHHYAELNKDPEGHKDRHYAMWEQISHRFKYAPNSVIFEFMNEPMGEMNTEIADRINRRLLSLIRKDQPDRWVIVAGGHWAGLRGLEESEFGYDPRTILTFHEYDPFRFTHQGAHFVSQPPKTGEIWGTDDDYSDMEDILDRAAALQETRGMPVFLGEFGVYAEVPDDRRALWIREMREGLEERNIGWCHWDFAVAFRAYNLDHKAWIEPIRAALLD